MTGYPAPLHVIQLLIISALTLLFQIKLSSRFFLSSSATIPILHRGLWHDTVDLSKQPPSKYAYVFIIGGCHPEQPNYKGFLYNVFVAAQLLHENGSQQDIIVLVQMSTKTNATMLPDEDLKVLQALRIRVMYLAKRRHESYYDLQMSKFQVLALTQYCRILFMDADVMPLTNLDYLFYLSDLDGLLKENVVVPTTMVPANGGFFMVAPKPGDFEELSQIVETRERNALNITSKHKFNQTLGWGHVMVPPNDGYRLRNGKMGFLWNFYAADCDQGLLYHWVKYVKKSVSIIFANGIVENWSAASNGTVHLEKTFQLNYSQYRQDPLIKGDCRRFMCDFRHFFARTKPWLKAYENTTMKDKVDLLWWNMLLKLSNEVGMNFQLSYWQPGQSPPLGYHA